MKILENILQRVRTVEQKNGIQYAKTDGKLYKSLKIGYLFVLIYTLIINSFFILGTLLSEYNYENLKNPLFNVCIFTSLLIISAFVMRFKNILWVNFTTGVLNVLSSLGLFSSFAVLMQDEVGFLGFKANFYWRHFVPLVLMIIFSVWLTVIAVRAILKTNSAYKKVVENIYSLYKVSAEESNFTEEQWDEILKDYNPKNNKK